MVMEKIGLNWSSFISKPDLYGARPLAFKKTSYFASVSKRIGVSQKICHFPKVPFGTGSTSSPP